MQRDLTTVLAGLYDAEIGFDIHSFVDGGVEVCLGDERTGFKAIHTFYVGQFDKMAQWFHDEAVKAWPETKYAKDNHNLVVPPGWPPVPK